MADTKISALPASTTPLAGTEVLPIVQGGATKKVAVSDLTAGRAISATELTLSTGNLIIGTAGKGIDFSATSGTGTSELLADYEEGSWTPTDASGAGLTLVSPSGRYTKIGRLVTVSGFWGVPVNADGSNLAIGGLPFTVGANSAGCQVIDYATAGEMSLVVSGTTFLAFYGASSVRRTNANYSAISIYFSASYIV